MLCKPVCSVRCAVFSAGVWDCALGAIKTATIAHSRLAYMFRVSRDTLREAVFEKLQNEKSAGGFLALTRVSSIVEYARLLRVTIAIALAL